MSFLMHSQRGYEHVSHQDLAQLSAQNQNRLHQMSASSSPPSPSFDDYSPLPLPSQPSCASHIPPSSNLVLDHANSGNNLPKVGETRCYWSLLSADLQFIYMDPVLTSHLAEQADSLVGKSLITFVHPDEQASVKHDLGNVLESKTLHGSVTRVRYSRLSRVRRLLGYQGPGPTWSDAEKIAIDINYMALDIVINWAAEGLVLCFLHAVVDLNPKDNDELNKTSWTNWCGTSGMTPDQLQILNRRLLMCVPQPGSMSRVFQIHSNQPGRPLLLSWPPDQANFAKLAEDVQIGGGQHSSDATTSCTRRYKAMQTMPSIAASVESVFIPHGTVIFACHKVYPSSRATATTAGQAMQHMGYGTNSYVSQSAHQQYYGQNTPYILPPSSPQYGNYLQSQQSQHQDPAQWSPGSDASTSQQLQQYHSWHSPSPAQSTSPLPPAVSNMRAGSYPPQSNQQWPSQASPYVESEATVSEDSPTYTYSTTDHSDPPPPPPTNVNVPSPRRRVSPGNSKDQFVSGGRSAGNRPVGVLRCSSCKATQSPEWRKGPSGKKELCNACGLRYARSRAKKEGHNLASQRRRKEKGLAAALAKRESATPPVSIASSGSPSYTGGGGGSRRGGGYDSGSFSTGSGGEAFGHHASHHGLDTLTPSPSPPSSSVSFVHYSPHAQGPGAADGRQAYTPTASGSGGSGGGSSYYSVPSPLSNPPVMNAQDGVYGGDRLSSSTTAPASYERDRDRKRELPPTPVSAEPRHQTRRSVMAHGRP